MTIESITGVLLPAIPLLLLVVSLLFGLYPGCEAVVRLSERIASRGRASPRRAAPPPQPVFAATRSAHGGLLLALSLSGRAPPA